MAEDTQGQKDPVTPPQDSPVPSENENGETTEETPEQSQEETESEGLPEDAKERTKREFEKLQTQLRDERTRREYYEQLFSQQPQQEQPFIDPNTGLPDENALANLSKQAQEAYKIAQEAKQKSLEFQRDQENQAVYSVHPELNPDTKTFNQDLHNLTRSFLLDSMVNPDGYGGKNLSFMEAAEKAKGLLGVDVEAAKKQGAAEAIEQLTPKEQASLAAVGSPGQRSQVESLDDLRQRSRGRDTEARLARIERFNRITKKQE